MRIGSFAQRTGLSRDTLRFYEKRGLLRPQVLANGYRDYPEALVERVTQIRLAQSLGFTLSFIATLLKEWDACGMSIARQLEVLSMQAARVDAQLKELQALRDYLERKQAWLQAGAQGTPPTLVLPAAAGTAPTAPRAAAAPPRARRTQADPRGTRRGMTG